MVNWSEFEKNKVYRLQILNTLLSTDQGRAVLSDLVRDLHQEWTGATFNEKMQIYKDRYLAQWEKVEAAPPVLYAGETLGLDWGKVGKWVGIGALTAVAGYGLLRFAPAALGMAAKGIGMAAGLLYKGGAVAVPALWKWSTVSGWRALGVSLAVLFSSEWAYSKIIGRKSQIEKVVEKSSEIVRAVPGFVTTGMGLAIVLFGAVALYNYTKKEK